MWFYVIVQSSGDDDSSTRDDRDSLTLDEMYSRFSAEKLHQFSVILSDVNQKLSANYFKP